MEMFLKDDEPECISCFRLTGGSMSFPNRYMCEYLHIGTDETGAVVRAGAIPASVAEQLSLEPVNLGH
jgi:hypothetical protein